MWAVCRVDATIARPVDSGARIIVPGRRFSASRGDAPSNAATRYRVSPSQRNKTPNLAPQIRTAFASAELNTGSNSPLDELMTLSTSDVAVCCSKDSVRSAVRWRNSLNNRAFSIAMTAWSANVVTSSICFSVKEFTLERADCRPGAQQRNPQDGAESCDFLALAELIFRIDQDVRYVDGAAFRQDTASDVAAAGLEGR